MSLTSTITWVKNVDGGGALIRKYPEGNSESYNKGAILLYGDHHASKRGGPGRDPVRRLRGHVGRHADLHDGP